MEPTSPGPDMTLMLSTPGPHLTLTTGWQARLAPPRRLTPTLTVALTVTPTLTLNLTQAVDLHRQGDVADEGEAAAGVTPDSPLLPSPLHAAPSVDDLADDVTPAGERASD